MTRTIRQIGTGQGRLWPVLLVLAAAVLVPAGCVVWFMSEAVSNESLAVRQRLRDLYSEKIVAARQRLEWDWERRLTRLAEGQDLPPGQRFALLATESGADGIVICDTDGQVVYPADPAVTRSGTEDEDPAWRAAASLEQDGGDPDAAAKAYAVLGHQAKDPEHKARAWQAQARCLLQQDNREAACRVLEAIIMDEARWEAVDASGRMIGPAAQLLHAQLRAAAGRTPALEAQVEGLRRRLQNYRGAPIPASQRRFLLQTLEQRWPSGQSSPTLAAEDLAAEYLQVEQPRAEPAALTPTRTAGLWQVATPDRRVVALYRLDPLLVHWQGLIRTSEMAGGLLLLKPPQTPAAPAEPFLSGAAGEHLPGWTLQVQLLGGDPFAAGASRKALYLWTGATGIALIAVLATAVAGFVGRQMRLTRLKNDLIATVSHELKTPLASMRMLVDTLLEGRYRDQEQVREYLQMIGRENQRLSRLIDNFLTFSRMERNKRTFQFAEVRLQDVVADAVEAVQERFGRPGCGLDVEVEPDLPAVHGDRDGLTTVLLNLLDNAYKYTGEEKRVCLRGFARDGQVVLEVTDNGIGIARRQQRRIFDRFYQVDQSLTRASGGCGLGLSIVRFIVTAHRGSVSVVSESGKGSCFRVQLPRPENDGKERHGG